MEDAPSPSVNPAISHQVIIGLIIGATVLLVAVLVAGYFSGTSYTAAYDKLPLPSDLGNAACKFGFVTGSTKQKLECTSSFSSNINAELAAVSKAFDDAGYTVDRNDVKDDGSGVVWAENGTWLIKVYMNGEKTKDGFVGHYDAVLERGGDFGQFN